MEFVSGGTLEKFINEFREIPQAVVVSTTRDILQGLDFLHSKHIIHRDIKPANILIQTGASGAISSVKLADFGVSKVATMLGSVRSASGLKGTIPYMSPRAFRSDHIPQSDLWAVGCTVKEMLTGVGSWHGSGFGVEALPYKVGQERQTPPLRVTFVGSEYDLTSDDVTAAFLERCWAAEAAPDTVDANVLLEHMFLQRVSTSPTGSGEVNVVVNDDRSNQTPRTLVFNSISTGGTSQVGQSLMTANPKWSGSTTIFRESPPVPLTWSTFWDRCSLLPEFAKLPFNRKFSHLQGIIRYCMCREGLPASSDPDVIDFLDDFKPFMNYFDDCVGMICDLDDLNHRKCFKLGVSTREAEALIREAPRGSYLLRPSGREKGKLVITCQRRRSSTSAAAPVHYVVVKEDGLLCLYSESASPRAPTILQLIHGLHAEWPEQFREGAGCRELPLSTDYYQSES
eukprot:TRINITY_DN2604_c0_g1_i2.p1 TRINITY_DN2604_c0_g1~~TRINITY_DN2604_c0_g1_i2.p1  ORF type:complete len:456 (+),score=129.42 TRINITY_DN2604_c0_g1_i2:381-1748(+)